MNGLALCAGGGGLELGLSLALGDAYRTVCVVEREVYAAAVLVSRMEEGRLHPAPVWDDLTTFNGRRWRGCVDILSAGFPCQPFSAAGKRQADDDSRHLWPHVRRVINGARPALVFLENVGALISTRQRDGRPAYMVVRNELERLGYRVAETLVRASDVGAPHQRERIFILGVSDSARRTPPWLGRDEHAGSEPETGCRTMGYASDRDGWTGWAGAERDQPGPRPATGGGTMGYADQSGLQRRHLIAHGPGECASRKAGSAMADAQRAATRGVSGELDGTQGTGEGEGQERERVWGTARHASAAFPPGPGDTDAWADILAERPELAPALEPAIRGVADGVAGALEHRTQRLRLLGNGVVPLAAAVAFRTLADTLGLAIEELRHTHTESMDESTNPADS